MRFTSKSFDVCNVKIAKKKGGKLFFLYVARSIYLTAKYFVKKRGALVASSLTYYSMLSIVPILALSLAIAKNFNIVEYIENELIERFSEHDVVLNKILDFSNNMLDAAKSGIVAILGLGILFISAFKVVGNMEAFINDVWEVDNKRKWLRKFVIYIVLILIIPLFLIVSGEYKILIAQNIQNYIEEIPFFSFFNFILKIFPSLLIWFLFTFIYIFVPKGKVQISKALIAGILAGFIYEIMQWGYIYFQMGVSRYSAVYSSFAALPLFLIWLQLSWFIILLGAVLSKVLSSIKYCEYEKKCENISQRILKSVAVYIVYIATKEKAKIISITLLYEKYKIPYSLSKRVLKQLIKAKVFKLAANKKDIVVEANINKLTVSDIYHAIETAGRDTLPMISTKKFISIDKTIKRFNSAIYMKNKKLLIKDL